MTIKRLNVLCEGSTEERFVKKVLSDYLKQYGIIVKPRQLTTSRKKNTHGGVTSYQRAKNDLLLWVKENRNDDYSIDYYTSMLDYYKLPTDFPGIPPKGTNAIDKVKYLERCLEENLGIPNFIPYIQLHEFEALVFASLDYLIADYPGKEKAIESLKQELASCNNAPEDVNNHPKTAPSKRLENALGKYNKVKSGAEVTSKVGIDTLVRSCPHFCTWIDKLKEI